MDICSSQVYRMYKSELSVVNEADRDVFWLRQPNCEVSFPSK
jgi:hypothetical protein